MPTTIRSRLLATALLAATLTLAACGDTSEPADAEAAVDCSSGGETVTVEIPEFAFAPDPVEIRACDAVVWTNTHSQPHTSTGDGEQTWTTGNIAPGESGEPVPFEDTGTFTYLCALHPFMQGTVEVS